MRPTTRNATLQGHANMTMTLTTTMGTTDNQCPTTNSEWTGAGEGEGEGSNTNAKAKANYNADRSSSNNGDQGTMRTMKNGMTGTTMATREPWERRGTKDNNGRNCADNHKDGGGRIATANSNSKNRKARMTTTRGTRVIWNGDRETGTTTTTGKGMAMTLNNEGRGETGQEGGNNNDSNWEDNEDNNNNNNNKDEGNQRTRKGGNDGDNNNGSGDNRDNENQDQTGMKGGHQMAGKQQWQQWEGQWKQEPWGQDRTGQCRQQRPGPDSKGEGIGKTCMHAIPTTSLSSEAVTFSYLVATPLYNMGAFLIFCTPVAHFKQCCL
jgi:hypothetical protein